MFPWREENFSFQFSLSFDFLWRKWFYIFEHPRKRNFSYRKSFSVNKMQFYNKMKILWKALDFLYQMCFGLEPTLQYKEVEILYFKLKINFFFKLFNNFPSIVKQFFFNPVNPLVLFASRFSSALQCIAKA